MDGMIIVQGQLIDSLEELIKEIEKEKDKFQDNDRIWDRIYIAKNVIKKAEQI